MSRGLPYRTPEIVDYPRARLLYGVTSESWAGTGAQSDLKLMPKDEVLQCDLAPGLTGGKNAADEEGEESNHPSGYPASQSAQVRRELDSL